MIKAPSDHHTLNADLAAVNSPEGVVINHCGDQHTLSADPATANSA